MPNLKDAPVLLSGTVIDTSIVHKRNEPGVFEARKVTIMVADGSEPGFAVVKIAGEDGLRLNPNIMEPVVWIVRSAPYSVDNNNGMSTRFIREVNPNDLDRIAALLKAPAKQ